MRTLVLIGVVALLASLLVGAFFLGRNQIELSIGSVGQTGEYHSTTTSFLGNPASLIKTGGGTLGSVIITGANTGVFLLYDATTTNKNLRAPELTSSTILLASFPASAATGTYTFDLLFSNGLLLERIGTSPSSTITWR